MAKSKNQKNKKQTDKKPASNLKQLLENKKSAEVAKKHTPADKKAAATAMTQAPIKRGGGGGRKAK
ncbi:MAG: hypothetical protein HOE85_04470 [Nitrospinaceae bacterium]|jgi:hypothetical protein|nr:hypothetical protein [Nitrospinaceae bacterium]MBT5947617.1 hypothetical protein [Nitrospinaceae bacterium]